MPSESEISDLLINWPKQIIWSLTDTPNGLRYDRRVIQLYNKKDPVLLFQEIQKHDFESMIKQFLSKTNATYPIQRINEQKELPIRLSDDYECVGMGYAVFFPKQYMISIENCDEVFRGKKARIDTHHLLDIKERTKSHFPGYLLVKEGTIGFSYLSKD